MGRHAYLFPAAQRSRLHNAVVSAWAFIFRQAGFETHTEAVIPALTQHWDVEGSPWRYTDEFPGGAPPEGAESREGCADVWVWHPKHHYEFYVDVSVRTPIAPSFLKAAVERPAWPPELAMRRLRSAPGEASASRRVSRAHGWTARRPGAHPTSMRSRSVAC